MKLNKLFALLALAVISMGCYEEYSYCSPAELYTDESFEEMFPEAVQISIAELKHAYNAKFGSISKTGSNGSWSDTKYACVGEDIFAGHEVYIKGKVTSDDEDGNIYKSLYVQDETSGIELKLNNSVGIKYKKGRWVYVYLNGLYLGNYRMMLSLGGEPSESWNKAGEHKFYANSNIELQSIIDQHVFPGRDAGELKVGDYYEWERYRPGVDIITVTPDNYLTVFNPAKIELEGKIYGKFQISQRELMFGRLMRFEGLQCRYAGVPSFEFDEDDNVVTLPVDKDEDGENDLNEDGTEIREPVVYTNPALKSGTFDNLYPSWLYSDPRPTVSKAWYHWAFKEEITGRSLYGSVLFAYDMEATNCSANGLYSLRTSGYSRFARQNVCRDGEKATITAIYGIYSKESNYAADSNDWASYQLTISSLSDIVFEKGEAALLTDEQVEALTTEDMKTVPWIDEEAGESEY